MTSLTGRAGVNTIQSEPCSKVIKVTAGDLRGSRPHGQSQGDQSEPLPQGANGNTRVIQETHDAPPRSLIVRSRLESRAPNLPAPLSN